MVENDHVGDWSQQPVCLVVYHLTLDWDSFT